MRREPAIVFGREDVLPVRVGEQVLDHEGVHVDEGGSQSDSPERMVLSAAAMLRKYGASATSIDRVLGHSDDAAQLVRSTAAVFARWQRALAALFGRHGLTEERRRRRDHVPGRAEHGPARGGRRTTLPAGAATPPSN